MNCQEIKELITPYLLGDLDEPTTAAVRQHLESCDGCRALADEIEPTLDLLRGALAATTSVPEKLSAKSRARILEQGRRQERPPLKIIKWLTISQPRLALAAAVLVVAGMLCLVALPVLHKSRQTAWRLHDAAPQRAMTRAPGAAPQPGQTEAGAENGLLRQIRGKPVTEIAKPSARDSTVGANAEGQLEALSSLGYIEKPQVGSSIRMQDSEKPEPIAPHAMPETVSDPSVTGPTGEDGKSSSKSWGFPGARAQRSEATEQDAGEEQVKYWRHRSRDKKGRSAKSAVKPKSAASTESLRTGQPALPRPLAPDSSEEAPGWKQKTHFSQQETSEVAADSGKESDDVRGAISSPEATDYRVNIPAESKKADLGSVAAAEYQDTYVGGMLNQDRAGEVGEMDHAEVAKDFSPLRSYSDKAGISASDEKKSESENGGRGGREVGASGNKEISVATVWAYDRAEIHRDVDEEREGSRSGADRDGATDSRVVGSVHSDSRTTEDKFDLPGESEGEEKARLQGGLELYFPFDYSQSKPAPLANGDEESSANQTRGLFSINSRAPVDSLSQIIDNNEESLDDYHGYDSADREPDTEAHLRRGRQHYMVGEYEEAQDNFDHVLKEDPSNTEATRWREKTAIKKHNRAAEEVDSTRRDMMYQVRKSWNKGDYIFAGTGPIADIDGDASIADTSEEQTRKKMESITIPAVDFKDADITDVVLYLKDKSKEYDPDGKGVTFVLKLGGGDAGYSTDEAEDFDSEDLDEGSHDELSGDEGISFSDSDRSLLEVLDKVTTQADLKYRVEGRVVLIVPGNYPESNLIRQAYPVLPTIRERMMLVSDEIGERDSKDEFISLAGGGGFEEGTTDWKEFFRNLGVDWPVGSEIQYLPSIGKVVVKNTASNIADFERVLAHLYTPEAAQRQEHEQEQEELTGPRFKAVGVNPFVSPAAEAFSTFSIDVDTASYTLARNYMKRGQLPPAEAVRTVEFVNFFDYNYAPPTHDVFKIYTDIAPSKFGQGLHTLKIGVKGKRLGREEQRPAVLTLLIDTSGSMDTRDRLGLLQKSLEMLVEQLAPHDQIAIVQYDSHARLVLEHTLASDKTAILEALSRLQCGGSTNLEEGMQKAYSIAAANFAAGAENRVLVLSDGVANLGAISADDVLANVERYRKQGIFSSVFGFGTGNYDDVMLETLANRGDGSYAFIDSEEEARRIFVDDLAATLNTIAADVKIQVEFNPDAVQRYRQLGYENRQLTKEQFRDDSVDAGEVGSGQAVTALYEIEQGTQSPDDIIATVRVRYQRTDTGKVEEIDHVVRAKHVLNDFAKADTGFRLAATVAEFSEILRGSPFAVGSEYEDVARHLRPVSLELDLDPRLQELLQMVEGASSMSRAEYSQ